MWSSALDAILLTLRYLAPATLLTLFWGQQSFLFKLLKYIDSAFRTIVFSSEEQKQEVLRWLAEAGPVRVEHLETVWRHGWILCGVLDAALPGACAGHPPTRMTLKHAQAIADHYLGVEPVFTRQELETNDSLSKHQEWKLATYLDRIRQALAKLTPPVSKPASQRTSPETTQFTLDYVARGSGLTAAQVFNKSFFKIYPTSQQSLDPGEITILIRGPKDTYGMTVLPPLLGKAQMIRQKMLGLKSKPSFTENALPITQGATYLRSYGKNNMNKTYYIPKAKYDIEIEEEIREDHMKIGYTVVLEGKYEVSITSRGQSIVGSPFTMKASHNIIGILEKESFYLEGGEEIDVVDVKADRKVVLRIVDFVTEKMLLKENGSLATISNDEAKLLMATNNVQVQNFQPAMTNLAISNDDCMIKTMKFNKVANKVKTMNKICKIFNDLIKKKTLVVSQAETATVRHQQAVPDIVNSTFSESNSNPFSLTEKRDKYIIPENISVSLRTEKPKSFKEEDIVSAHVEIDNFGLSTSLESNTPDSLELYETIEDQIEQDMLDGRSTSSCNPFLNITYDQSYVIEKHLGSFVKTEYETNNSQNEETEETFIKIIVDESDTPSPLNTNPFLEPDVVNLERPKTPVLKIITGEVKDRADSPYIDPDAERIAEELFANEFLNPFFIHHHPLDQLEEKAPIADFIIGAPVSLPPLIRASTPEPNMGSLLITSNRPHVQELQQDRVQDNCTNIDSSSVFSTPLHTNTNKKNGPHGLSESVSSSFHSLDSNLTENVEILSLPNTSDSQSVTTRDISPKKDMWDSAYVSIDDSNSSPDSNNNDNLSELPCKQKHNDKSRNFATMGPAEREMWRTCSELKDTLSTDEELKPTKWDTKRPICTPIIEENDRSMSSNLKDLTTSDTLSVLRETDPVTVAFAEINDMYYEYYPNSESSSTATTKQENYKQLNKQYTIERNESVNSASAKSDVKRHAKALEGEISEVQSNVAESGSVSQILHHINHKLNLNKNDLNKDETQFGDKTHTNIVSERKQYWDERIRQIEAKSEENKTQQRKKRLCSKHLRLNDSLTKRRGKQIAKNFLIERKNDHRTDSRSNESKDIEIVNKTQTPAVTPQTSIEEVKTDSNFVERWKRFWDSKLEIENNENEATCFRTKSPKSKDYSQKPENYKQSIEDIIEVFNESKVNINKSPTPRVKQELPEEVFKAFETSPKRFFGTSRKQILNKIDTFLGKPSTADEPFENVGGASGAGRDTGLVSSRISLFHNISQTEELPWARRKCQSMHNIFQRKDSNVAKVATDKSVMSSPKNNQTTDNKDIHKYENLTEEVQRIPVQLDRPGITASSLDDTNSITLKEKRARLVQQKFYKTYDEAVYKKPAEEHVIEPQVNNVKKAIKGLVKQDQHHTIYKHPEVLRKSCMSKSEMDIFSKITCKPTDDDFDKYKSCDELPKTNVKSFISLYESVSKPDAKVKPMKKVSRTNSMGLHKPLQSSLSSESVNKTLLLHQRTTITPSSFKTLSPENHWSNNSQSMSESSYDPKSLDSMDIEIISTQNLGKDVTYLSLSDIELEIIESSEKSASSPEKTSSASTSTNISTSASPEKSSLTSSENGADTAHKEYKSRFKMAKQFFQSLEELRDENKPPKLNECELLLINKSTESLEKNRQQKRVKKNIKSHSMPSSELSKIWNQLEDAKKFEINTQLVKISEKFNVEDLFNDVMEGKLSRQGSLRGIPHKKAVLEAFRSMENLTDSKMSSYEFTVSQLTDFAKENNIRNAQTYLTEYPYLPTTEPSKYHSRLDTKATGLISLKELQNQKPRRNSVPDIRLNAKFTVDL